MSYDILIGDEVYWGSPNYEEFEVIQSLQEEGDLIKIVFEGNNKSTRISKEDLDLFLKNDKVEFISKSKDGLSLESLITCDEMLSIFKQCEE